MRGRELFVIDGGRELFVAEGKVCLAVEGHRVVSTFEVLVFEGQGGVSNRRSVGPLCREHAVVRSGCSGIWVY